MTGTKNRVFLRRSRTRLGLSMVELMVATAIGLIFSLLTMSALIGGAYVLRDASQETRLRELAGNAQRQIMRDIRLGDNVAITRDHEDTSGDRDFGSCLVITDSKSNPGTTAVHAYYFHQPEGANQGTLYYDEDVSSPPNPDDDELLVDRVLDFEARWNPNGSVRIGMIADSRAADFFDSASSEGNRLQLETSVFHRELN